MIDTVCVKMNLPVMPKIDFVNKYYTSSAIKKTYFTDVLVSFENILKSLADRGVGGGR